MKFLVTFVTLWLNDLKFSKLKCNKGCNKRCNKKILVTLSPQGRLQIAQEGGNLPKRAEICPRGRKFAQEGGNLPRRAEICPRGRKFAQEGGNLPKRAEICPRGRKFAQEDENPPPMDKDLQKCTPVHFFAYLCRKTNAYG